ncbi:MAG: hypothetical protein KGK07_14510 [Chloroflexota bacterium]|nr:hypothetical protein [Chloroflexota bacterium]
MVVTAEDALMGFQEGATFLDQGARRTVRDLIRRYGPEAVAKALPRCDRADPKGRAEQLGRIVAEDAADERAPEPPAGDRAADAERRERDDGHAQVAAWQARPGARNKGLAYLALMRRYLADDMPPEEYMAELRRLFLAVPPPPSAAVRDRVLQWLDSQAPLTGKRGPLVPALAGAVARPARPARLPFADDDEPPF